MNDYSIPGYDAWKLMSPEDERQEPVGNCDCCASRDVTLWRGWVTGIETWACDACWSRKEEEGA